MHYPVKIISLWFLLTVRRVRPKSPKRPTSLWANLSGMEFDRIIKTTALYQSQGINLQSRVRLFRYSYWLLPNVSVNFDDQKLTDTLYNEGHCGRSILKHENPSDDLFVQCLGNICTKFQGNPSNPHALLIILKKGHSRKNEVGFFSF